MKSKSSLGKSVILAAALALGLSVQVASASGIDVGVTAGTMGAGLQLGYTVVPNTFDARLSTGFLSYSTSANSSDMHYTGTLSLKNAALLADYHPFGGAFRVTAGAVINNTGLDLSASPNAGTTYTSNGVTYTAGSGDQMDAKIAFKKVAPYVGIGWGNNDNTAGLHFTSDVGLMYQNISSTITATSATNQAAASAYAVQAQTDLNNNLHHLKWYPVIQVGAVYRF